MARVLKGGLRDGKKAHIDPYPFDPRAEAEKILSEAKHEAERLRNQALLAFEQAVREPDPERVTYLGLAGAWGIATGHGSTSHGTPLRSSWI